MSKPHQQLQALISSPLINLFLFFSPKTSPSCFFPKCFHHNGKKAYWTTNDNLCPFLLKKKKAEHIILYETRKNYQYCYKEYNLKKTKKNKTTIPAASFDSYYHKLLQIVKSPQVSHSVHKQDRNMYSADHPKKQRPERTVYKISQCVRAGKISSYSSHTLWSFELTFP